MESVASLMGAAPGAFLDQADTVRRLVSVLGGQYRVREKGESFDHEAFVVEWVRRDFLNVAFGNSDNHGRNSALLKGPEGIRLSPVFDFAPMRMDPEGVVRTLRWSPPLEAGGTFDWHAVARELSDLISPDHLIHELEQLARRLVRLADRLEHRGLPQRVLTAESVGLARLEARLRRWGLL
jgi:serine/threonine-protein kinase HipA